MILDTTTSLMTLNACINLTILKVYLRKHKIDRRDCFHIKTKKNY